MFLISKIFSLWPIAVGLMLCCLLSIPCGAKIHHRTFVIQEATYTRLCHTKNILTVNGSYPGPTISARKGDIVYVKVINRGNKNITIHWHGVHQPRDPWSDGPEYITQCPIQPRANYTQRIQFTEEEGTLWWHAHSEFDRATVHGAIVIYPKLGTTFPFRKPHKEFTLFLGEWWNKNITDIYQSGVKYGGIFNLSDANTINGQPGDFMPCSSNDTFKVQVQQGKMYLLRVINAAMENEFFFAVSGHNVTVVGIDGSYTKPYVNEFIMITPGQSMDLLLWANQYQNSSSPFCYYIIASLFFDVSSAVPRVANKNSTVAILEYKTNNSTPSIRPVYTSMPQSNDTKAAAVFTSGLRSLTNSDDPAVITQTADVNMYITLSVNEALCPNNSCAGSNGTRFAAGLNNISFQHPKIDVLDAYYNSIAGVYTTDFPDKPSRFFNFTDVRDQAELKFVDKSTKVKVVEYNSTVEIVFQDTNVLDTQVNHPVHLHGHSFYVIGSGHGNFNLTTDPLSYNLVDPPYQSTLGVPTNGWATIRFRATNPGVWYMHCHYETHSIWGMDLVFIIKDGNSTEAKMLPPPADKPPC